MKPESIKNERDMFNLPLFTTLFMNNHLTDNSYFNSTLSQQRREEEEKKKEQKIEDKRTGNTDSHEYIFYVDDFRGELED